MKNEDEIISKKKKKLEILTTVSEIYVIYTTHFTSLRFNKKLHLLQYELFYVDTYFADINDFIQTHFYLYGNRFFFFLIV